VVSGLNCLLHTLDDPLDRQVATLLDAEQTPAPDEGRLLALLLVKHARGLLADLAAEHRRPLKDFRCTLLLAIPGQRHLLWLKIGDGALVIERTQAAAAPGASSRPASKRWGAPARGSSPTRPPSSTSSCNRTTCRASCCPWRASAAWP